ncbi:hypothetical protein [Cellulomonas hominis]
MVAFGDAHGSSPGDGPSALHTVSLTHVVRYLQDYLRENWPVLRHVQRDDSPFAVLALIEKWRVDTHVSNAEME